MTNVSCFNMGMSESMAQAASQLPPRENPNLPKPEGHMMTDYYKREKAGFEELAEKGSLKRREFGPNRIMYSIPLPTGDFTVAVSLPGNFGDEGLVIRAGDTVTLKRRAPDNKDYEVAIPITDMRLNESNGEIDFDKSKIDVEKGGFYRLQDAVDNQDAVYRADLNQRAQLAGK